MDENCVITPCEKEEYEEPIVPAPTESDLVQVYDSIDQITNPNSNHIYVVGNDAYVFDGVSFVSISGCDIPVYTGDYTVTAPSEGDLVLPTKDKLMDDDVTINANRTLENALIQHTPLEEYRNDEVTEVVGEYAFGRCMIKKLYLPNVTTFTNVSYCMDGGGSSLIEEVHLPRWTRGLAYAFFDSNPNLRLIDYGFMTLTYMRNCPNLKTLILRRASVQTLSASNAWVNSPLHPNGSGCYVYVPQALLSQYQASTEWQTNAHVLEFRPIEGSEYEIDGLESTSNSIQSFSLNSPFTDTFDAPLETFDTLPLETFDTPSEDEFIPTEELESEE